MKSTKKYYLEQEEIKNALRFIIPELKLHDFQIKTIVPVLETDNEFNSKFKLEVEIDLHVENKT